MQGCKRKGNWEWVAIFGTMYVNEEPRLLVLLLWMDLLVGLHCHAITQPLCLILIHHPAFLASDKSPIVAIRDCAPSQRYQTRSHLPQKGSCEHHWWRTFSIMHIVELPFHSIMLISRVSNFENMSYTWRKSSPSSDSKQVVSSSKSMPYVLNEIGGYQTYLAIRTLISSTETRLLLVDSFLPGEVP